jgi:hypothetical protein
MATPMDFDEASRHELRFGKFRGRSIGEVAESDEGLRYLDWLSGQTWLEPYTAEALAVYLKHGVIARDVDRLIGD